MSFNFMAAVTAHYIVIFLYVLDYPFLSFSMIVFFFFFLALKNIFGLKTFILWEISNIYKSIENIVLNSPISIT